MLRLFPKIKPNRSFHLAAEAPHELYVEESGNPEGLPVVVLHGGPGAGTRPLQRRFFDPQIFRIVLFDQRGAGRSRPHSCLDANTTQALVHDIELIRRHLDIDTWVVFGGSWGSTLGLVYAGQHPDRVRALILRGIFLCRPQDIRWFYQQGASRIFPEYWEEFTAQIPESERDDLLLAYHRRLTGGDELVRMAAAKAWSLWEGRCSTLQPDSAQQQHFADPRIALSLARIEAHYLVNNGFLEPDQILRNIRTISRIPGIIVHGRYDMVSPIAGAVELHRAWPGSRLLVLPAAGHADTEPAITDALLRAAAEIAATLTRNGS